MLQRKEILSMNPVSSAVTGIDQYGKELIVRSLPPNPLPNNKASNCFHYISCILLLCVRKQ